MPTRWAALVGQELAPDSWVECVDLLLSSGGQTAIYRGHRTFEWDLQSTLERALLDHAQRWDERRYQLMLSMAADHDTDQWVSSVETSLTRIFRQNAIRFGVADLPEEWDTLGWWEVMQHHGAPTRLMDWTRSPFTAVWFALEGHEEGDMALWVYDTANGEKNHADAIAEMRRVEDEELDLRRQQNRLVKLVLDDGVPALLPVTPRQFSRAVAQQSVLTVSPSIGVGRPADWWIRHRLATRIRLSAEWKRDMISACQSMGLSRPGLYRDLDSLGKYLRHCFAERVDVQESL